jgi:hypothetical protein
MKEIMTKQVCQTKRTVQNVCPTSVKSKNKTRVMGKICEKSIGKNNGFVSFYDFSQSQTISLRVTYFYVEGLYVLFS